MTDLPLFHSAHGMNDSGKRPPPRQLRHLTPLRLGGQPISMTGDEGIPKTTSLARLVERLREQRQTQQSSATGAGETNDSAERILLRSIQSPGVDEIVSIPSKRSRPAIERPVFLYACLLLCFCISISSLAVSVSMTSSYSRMMSGMTMEMNRLQSAMAVMNHTVLANDNQLQSVTEQQTRLISSTQQLAHTVANSSLAAPEVVWIYNHTHSVELVAVDNSTHQFVFVDNSTHVTVLVDNSTHIVLINVTERVILVDNSTRVLETIYMDNSTHVTVMVDNSTHQHSVQVVDNSTHVTVWLDNSTHIVHWIDNSTLLQQYIYVDNSSTVWIYVDNSTHLLQHIDNSSHVIQLVYVDNSTHLVQHVDNSSHVVQLVYVDNSTHRVDYVTVDNSTHQFVFVDNSTHVTVVVDNSTHVVLINVTERVILVDNSTRIMETIFVDNSTRITVMVDNSTHQHSVQVVDNSTHVTVWLDNSTHIVYWIDNSTLLQQYIYVDNSSTVWIYVDNSTHVTTQMNTTITSTVCSCSETLSVENGIVKQDLDVEGTLHYGRNLLRFTNLGMDNDGAVHYINPNVSSIYAIGTNVSNSNIASTELHLLDGIPGQTLDIYIIDCTDRQPVYIYGRLHPKVQWFRIYRSDIWLRFVWFARRWSLARQDEGRLTWPNIAY